MAELTTTQSFADGDTVTAAKLNNIIANASVGSEVVTNRSELTSVDGANDFILIHDTSAAGLRKIKPNNVVADSAITTGKLGDSSVTTIKIADGSVSSAKLATLSPSPEGTYGTTFRAPTVVINNKGQVTSFVEGTTEIAVLQTAQSFTRAKGFAITTLTEGTSIAWDLAANQVTRITLTGNRTLANPTNKVDGNVYVLVVKQDATGGRTLSFSSDYKFAGGTAPTITTTASKADVLTFVCEGTNLLGVASQSFL